MLHAAFQRDAVLVPVTVMHTEESTWGLLRRRREARRRRESDEAVFFLALLPVDTGGSAQWTDWIYGPEDDREYRVRDSTDVDSNEDHFWQFPMAFKFDPTPNRIFEFLLHVYEVDGGTETAAQAQNIARNIRNRLNDKLRPGMGLGSSPDATGDSGPTTYNDAFEYGGDGGNDELLFVDGWHVDPNNPLALFHMPSIPGGGPGRRDPDLQIAEHHSKRSITRAVSRFPPRPNSVIERREYTNANEHASYRFDVHYSV